MKAAYIKQTGPPEVIQYGELPDPKPGPTEALVKVGAVSVNPIDTYIRSGAVAMPLQFPFIIGADVAGTVVACGAEVRGLKPGDRVWATNQGSGGRQGTFAELIAVDESWLHPTAAHQSDAEAAAGALVGITAHLGVFLHARLQPGETLLVNGGTGGVGAAVVQFAKWAGARVITTVGSEDKQKLCESWGADLVLDYHSPTLDDEIRKVRGTVRRNRRLVRDAARADARAERLDDGDTWPNHRDGRPRGTSGAARSARFISRTCG